MSQIADLIKNDETPDMVISDQDRQQLIDMLAMVAVAIRAGTLWFNQPDLEYNEQFACFAERMAQTFANLTVQVEQ